MKIHTQIQERDFALLQGLFESRIMTLAHIARLYFQGRSEAAKKRVQKLRRAGYIKERPRLPLQPAILFLSKKSFQMLRDSGRLHHYPALGWQSLEKRTHVSPLTLRHELAVMDVKAALCAAIAGGERLQVQEFLTWPLLYSFRARRPPTAGQGVWGKTVWVRPDGLMRIREREPDGGCSEHILYLELDRSTETLDTLRQRVLCYRDYYQSGGLAARFGHPRDQYAQFPFRVLLVFANAERRNNAAASLLSANPRILTLAWLTTLPELLAMPLERICIRPADYLAAAAGTPFDPAHPAEGVYRRDSEREKWIETHVPKLPLFDTAPIEKERPNGRS